MKTNLLKSSFLIIALIFGLATTTIAQTVWTAENFDARTVGAVLEMKRWYEQDGSATVVADPALATNKCVNIKTTNWDAILKLNITLPQGKKQSDITKVSFDIYLKTNVANQIENNSKNMNIFVDGNKIYEDTNHPQQAPDNTWTTKEYSLNLSSDANTLVLDFGISTPRGDYYIDNVKFHLKGDNIVPISGDYLIENFESKAINEVITMKKWYDVDGTALVKANPTVAGEKAVQIITTNWDALLKLNVTLPAGKTLAHYNKVKFDIYLLPNVLNQIENNHKNMHVFINDDKVYEDTNFPAQAPDNTWTTKEYTLNSTAGNTLSISLGISSPRANYYIDNVRLVGIASSTHKTSAEKLIVSQSSDQLMLGSIVENVQVFDTKGTRIVMANNTKILDISTLNKGVYLIRINKNGSITTEKILK